MLKIYYRQITLDALCFHISPKDNTIKQNVSLVSLKFPFNFFYYRLKINCFFITKIISMVNTRLIGNLNIVLGFNDFEKNGKIILFIDVTWKIVHLIQTCTIWY